MNDSIPDFAIINAIKTSMKYRMSLKPKIIVSHISDEYYIENASALAISTRQMLQALTKAGILEYRNNRYWRKESQRYIPILKILNEQFENFKGQDAGYHLKKAREPQASQCSVSEVK